MTAILTAEQQAVVDADLSGPRLVDAGAGTGKTFTLVRRAVALVRRGVLRADELLVVTFTKSAATEIGGRLESELDPRSFRRPTCGTFHGIASDLLREFAYESGLSPDVRVIDDGRARGVFSRAFADLVAGRLEIDLSAFPLLDRLHVLERSLAKMVLRSKNQGRALDHCMARAREAVADLEAIDYGSVQKPKKSGDGFIKGWPRPDPPRSPDERRTEAARERLNVEVVATLFGHFQHLLDTEHLLTFGDILTRATRMLREYPAIARVLRSRWKHAIVDEFQDSNHSQIAFLEALFGDDLAPVFVVGDVRQAIYEFTGAQPQGIVDFRERAREILPLTENRRSFQPILDVAHAALATLGGVSPELNSRLVAHRGDVAPHCVRLEFFGEENALEREAASIASKLRELVDSGVEPQRCAVLLRARTRAAVFAQAIRDRGLAVQLHGGVGFFDAREIREVTAWLRLADDPTDAFAVVAALQSAAIGVSDGCVALLARDGNLARAALLDAPPPQLAPQDLERLERFRRTARVVCALADAPLVDAVRSIVLSSGAEIARIADESALAQVRANLDKFVRFAADFAGDRPLARISDLVGELRERDELDLDLPLAEVEGDRITIMTIHGAKGLEWDHVFLADLSSRSFPIVNNDQRDNVAQFDSTTGALALKHGVDRRITLRWFLTQHRHDANGNLIDKAPASESREEFRLLYVALTRARDAVYVSGRGSVTSGAGACYNAVRAWAQGVSASLDSHRFAATRAEPVQAVLPLGLVAGSTLAREFAARAARSAAVDATPIERRGSLSYTAMELHERCPRRARYHYVLGLPDLTDEAPIGHAGDDEDGRENRDPARHGRVIHRALEHLAKARIIGATPDRDGMLSDALAEEEWVAKPQERTRIETSIDAALRCLAPLEPIDAERRFDVEIDGVALGGYIDLIARDTVGRIAVIDYKTGRTAAEHYALQFALYAYAIREQFPQSTAQLLRIGTDGASFETVDPASHEILRTAVANARTMESDEPRPGAQCSYCPYARVVCSAAP